jgi:hypothetical protein
VNVNTREVLGQIITELQKKKTEAHNEMIAAQRVHQSQLEPASVGFWHGKVVAYDEAIKLVGNADKGE